MGISCSQRSGIPNTVSQHFGCPTGGVWKEPASRKQQCLGILMMAFLPVASSWAVKTVGPMEGHLWLCSHVSSLPPTLSITPSPNPCAQSLAEPLLLFCSIPPSPPTCLISTHPRTPPPPAQAPKEGHCKMKPVLFSLFLPQTQAPETREAPGACGSECACLGGDCPALESR